MKSRRLTSGGAIQGVGDILVYAAAEKTQRDTVDRCFEILSGTVDRMLRLKDKSEERFFEAAVDPKFAARSEEDLGFALWMSPDRVLKGFTLPMEQVKRGLEAASASGNDYFVEKAMNWLDDVLEALVTKPGNGQLIRATISQYTDILRSEHKSGHDYGKSRASHDWCFDVIMRRPSFTKRRVRPEYLDLLAEPLFGHLRWMISDGQEDVFADFYRSTVDGVYEHDDGNDAHDLWDYTFRLGRERYDALNAAANVDELLAALRADEEGCVTSAFVTDAATRLRGFYQAASVLLSDSEQNELKRLCRGIVVHLEHRAKLHLLTEVTFAVAAFCLAKGRPDYVQRMLQYKCPPGSTYISCNRDPLPTQPNEILKSYAMCWSSGRRFDQFGSHLDGGNFKRRLAVDLIARSIGPGEPEAAGSNDAILRPLHLRPEQPQFDSSQVSALGYEVERMASFAADMAKDDPDSLLIAGGDTERAKAALLKTEKALRLLHDETTRAIEKAAAYGGLSPRKIDEFKRSVLESFRTASGWRDFLTDFPDVYLEEPLDVPTHGDMFGINIFTDKAAFIDNWYAHYVNNGEAFGHGLGHDEGVSLMERIISRCESVDVDDLAGFLSSLPKGRRLVAFTTSVAAFRLSTDSSERFTPRWAVHPEPERQHLDGWLNVHGDSVPVYRLGRRAGADATVMLDLERFGRFVQKSPLTEEDDPDWLVGFLKVAVLESDSDKKMFESILSDNPDWIQNRESSLSPGDYLRTRAWVRVYERFSLELSDEFQGWSFEFPKEM